MNSRSVFKIGSKYLRGYKPLCRSGVNQTMGYPRYLCATSLQPQSHVAYVVRFSLYLPKNYFRDAEALVFLNSFVSAQFPVELATFQDCTFSWKTPHVPAVHGIIVDTMCAKLTMLSRRHSEVICRTVV